MLVPAVDPGNITGLRLADGIGGFKPRPAMQGVANPFSRSICSLAGSCQECSSPASMRGARLRGCMLRRVLLLRGGSNAVLLLQRAKVSHLLFDDKPLEWNLIGQNVQKPNSHPRWYL